MSFNKRNVNGEGNHSEASKELNQELLVPPDHERNTPVVLTGDHFAPRGHLAMSGDIWVVTTLGGSVGWHVTGI